MVSRQSASQATDFTVEEMVLHGAHSNHSRAAATLQTKLLFNMNTITIQHRVQKTIMLLPFII